MKKVIVFSLLMICALLWGGNSIFSYDGYPIRYYGKDIYSLGMGDTGASDLFRFNGGYGNPAQCSRSNKTIFGTGFIFGYTKYESEYNGAKSSFRDDALDFPYFSVSVPFKRHRFGFQFSPFATGVVKNQFARADSTIELQETEKYIYHADLIYSYIFRGLNVGLSGNFFFGHDYHTFEQVSADYTVPTTESLKSSFKNSTITIGAIQTLKDQAFGLHATLPVTLEGETKRNSFHSSEPLVDYDYKLPLMLTASYTGMMIKELKLASDFSFERYSQTSDDLRDAWKLGVGVAYEPDLSRKKHWWQKVPLRAGYAYRQLSFPSAGEDVDENTISAGLSIPLKNEINRVDMAFQYQTRGSLETNHLQEKSYMMMFGFTGFDIITTAPDRKAPRDIPKAEVLEQW
ncbi:MAG: hypothetical protein PHT37_01425 [Candidatus Cloacimonetes bacterium]|nr:hypothetical protein [Candidatus Cloacimonadota bacterium]MDD2422913.1 hypothetical protein [Candidatus Cloacimonadota bacterium]MDD3562283.1 hypothetical protein [Candidatus Cloacimonadota bacterium]MDD4276539.1 hypothetical protein [Candidatus Cloacimonadota bacterium]